MKIILSWFNANFDTLECRCQVSLPPSGEYEDRHALEMQFGYNDPNTNISGLSDQPRSPTVRPQCARSVGLQEFCFHTPRLRPPLNRTAQALSVPFYRTLKPQCRPRETRAYPSTIQSLLLFNVDRCSIITSPICFFLSPHTSFLLHHLIYSRFVNNYRVKN